MAVPKKKTSKIKKAKRRYQWFLVAQKRALKALSISFQILKKELSFNTFSKKFENSKKSPFPKKDWKRRFFALSY